MAWSDELGLPGEIRWINEPGAAIPAPPGGWQEGVPYDIQGQPANWQMGDLIPAVIKGTQFAGPIIGAAAGLLGGLLFGGGNGAEGGVDRQVDLPFIPSGPGVPEPPQAMISKAWKIKVTRSGKGGLIGEITGGNEWWVFFWRLLDGRTVMYNPMKRQWKMWKDYKSIVIGKCLTTQNVRRVATRLHEHTKSLTKVLRIVK